MATAPIPAAAQSGAGLSPSSSWILDYDDDSCALRRMFGTGKDQVFLEMRRFGPGQSLQITVASNGRGVQNPALLKFRFGPNGDWRDFGDAPTLANKDGYRGLIFRTEFFDRPGYEELSLAEKIALEATKELSDLERDYAARVDSLTLRGGFRRDLTIPMGPMAEPIAALNACVEELTTHWNIDPVAHRTLTRPAVPINIAEVPGMMSYPPAMVRAEMPGIVNVRLDIDPSGKVSACHIQMPLSDPAFEESSCADIQHAIEFDPALDKDGKPIASYWTTSVIFRLT